MGMQRSIYNRTTGNKGGDATENFTGCCSSLSAPASPAAPLQDELQSACFDSDRDYNLVNPHLTITREEILHYVDDHNGLCISDEQLDSFIESQVATENAIEESMRFS